jgi:hypothetical protein
VPCVEVDCYVQLAWKIELSEPVRPADGY